MEVSTAARGASSRSRGKTSSHSRRRRRTVLAWASGLITFAVGFAPLAAGGVHRPVVLLIGCLILPGVGVLAAAEWRAGNRIRMSPSATFPAAFVVLTALQIVPLPRAIADRLDPKAASLLIDGGGGATDGWRPLSLDAPATYEALLRAVLAFLVFLAIHHLAAKREGRSWVLRSVAAAGVAAVVIGLGHRIFAIPKIYGIFPNTRYLAILTGPFVNANHTAEFLELTTFVGIACARQASTQLARMGWYAAAVTCAAGAMATLSRASIAGLGVGAAVMGVGALIEHRAVAEGRLRRGLLPVAVGVAGLMVVATSIGAAQLLDRFHDLSLGNDARFRLWRDSLRVLRQHPFGIGRGAFDTVYPVHRTLMNSFPVRFSFVENQPLQMLIDFGYVGFALLACAAVFPVRELVKNGRRDRVEVALLAAVLAVCAHSLADFGLETLGVLLPFMAVLGSMLGRTRGLAKAQVAVTDPGTTRSRGARLRSQIPIMVGLALGLLVLARLGSADASHDFDVDLKSAGNPQQMRTVISDARRAHPLDYYYPLILSSIEPLSSSDRRYSPRLRALNQALRLCQNCPEVHLQIARTMWRIGRRSQALGEWSTAVRGQPEAFSQALVELVGLGAVPKELARLAEGEPRRLLEIATFLIARGSPAQAAPIINAASEAGAPALEVCLLRARISLAGPTGFVTDDDLAELKRLAPADPRVAFINAEQIEKKGGKDAGVEALGVVERALDRDPNDLDLQRKRIEIVTRFERWSAAERSIVGFKQALQATNHSTVEANVAAAAIHLRLGRTRDALAEYRIATTAEPENPNVWRQLALTAQAARHYVLAREAYAEVMRLAPDKQISEEMRKLDDLQASERLGINGPGDMGLR